jgi:hypothetical protein
MRTRDRLAMLGGAMLAMQVLAAGNVRAQQDDPDDGPMAPGHPQVQGGSAHGGGAGAGGGVPGMFTPPEDVEEAAPNLPPGTIAIDLRDADDKPVPNETITLGIMINSIAKGDSRQHKQATTDATGHAVFGGLETASNVAYRVSCGFQGGAFAATPFQLQQAKNMHVVLHVYNVVRDVQTALVVSEATVAAEMRDDRIQVEEVLTFYNLGRTAWQPTDVIMKLPAGVTAFSAQANMSDQGVDEVDERAKLRGTFGPGRHSLEFRWQLPWSGDSDVDFEVGMPPHVAIARVMLPATSEIKLGVEGFPPALVRRDQQGQSFLVTEKRVTPEDPKVASLAVGIHNLPSEVWGPRVAVGLSSIGVILGLGLAFGRRRAGPSKRADRSARAAVLEELAELERGRRSGEIGPKTYERAHRELIDALARTLAAASRDTDGGVVGKVPTTLGAAAGAD